MKHPPMSLAGMDSLHSTEAFFGCNGQFLSLQVRVIALKRFLFLFLFLFLFKKKKKKETKNHWNLFTEWHSSWRPYNFEVTKPLSKLVRKLGQFNTCYSVEMSTGNLKSSHKCKMMGENHV